MEQRRHAGTRIREAFDVHFYILKKRSPKESEMEKQQRTGSCAKKSSEKRCHFEFVGTIENPNTININMG